MERHDPARTGYAPDANGPTEIPDVSWQATIIDEESGLNWLACSEETVYAATEHTLSAFTAGTGKRRWQTNQLGTLPWIESPLVIRNVPTVSDEQLLIGTRYHLYAVDRTDGSALWEYQTWGTGAIVCDGNTVYVTKRGYTVAIDIRSGLERWKTPIDESVYPYAYAEGFVIGPTPDHPNSVGAINAATGTREWTAEPTEIGGSAFPYPYRPSPCIVNGTIYYGSGPLYALNLTDGTIRWEHSVGITDAELTPVSDGSVVYFVHDDSVRAIDAESGDLRWRVDLSAYGAPALIDGTLYVGLEHGLVALDSKTGNERFRVTLSKSEYNRSSPIVAGGTVYIKSHQTLYALSDQ